jgi:hypothetical protein
VFTGDTLADDLGVLVDEDLGLGTWLVDSTLGEGDEW